MDLMDYSGGDRRHHPLRTRDKSSLLPCHRRFSQPGTQCGVCCGSGTGASQARDFPDAFVRLAVGSRRTGGFVATCKPKGISHQTPKVRLSFSLPGFGARAGSRTEEIRLVLSSPQPFLAFFSGLLHTSRRRQTSSLPPRPVRFACSRSRSVPDDPGSAKLPELTAAFSAGIIPE